MKMKTVLNTVFEPLNIINEKGGFNKRYDYSKKRKLNHCDENIILDKKKLFLN